MNNQRDHRSPGHPLATGALSNNLRLMWRNGGPDGRFALRVMSIVGSNLFLLPFRLIESQNWRSRIAETKIEEPPLFIIGAWRSGTTYLHNVLVQDDRWGYVTTLQAFCPDICIEGSSLLAPIFRKLLPKKRPMDNILLALEYPQEEEYAVGNLSPFSFYHGYFFPSSMNALFDLLTFSEGDEGNIKEWIRTYLSVLKKATLIMGGRRLLLKNPLNTCRIPLLLEMFPGAKFIFLFRNPYDVYFSLVHMFMRMIDAYQLKKTSMGDIKEFAFRFYEIMMQRYWSTKSLIPPGDLIEIRYEDLDNQALSVVAKIYEELRLPGFDSARESMKRYIASQCAFQKNNYTRDPETMVKISRRWRFAFDNLGYAS